MNKDVTDLNTIKLWFKTGLKPKQNQFWAWMDSFWHKEEKIPQDQIEGLTATLGGKVDVSSLANINSDIRNLNENKANTSDLDNKANVLDLNQKANADASNINAQKFYEAIRSHIPVGGGTTADISKAEVSKMIENITIGGANLLKNTALPIFTANSQGRGAVSQMSDGTGYFVRYTPDSDKAVSVYGFNYPNSGKGEFTRSMDVRHSHTENIVIWGQNIPPNNWTRVKDEQYKNANDWNGFSSNTNGVAIDIRNLKLEKGNKATDWRPHLDEFVLGTSPTKIDQVFEWNTLNVGTETNGTNDRVIYGIPYFDAVAVVLEFYLIFTDGTAMKMEDFSFGSLSSGKVGIAFKSSSVGGKTTSRMYLKALLK